MESIFRIIGRMIEVIYSHNKAVMYFYDLSNGTCVDAIANPSYVPVSKDSKILSVKEVNRLKKVKSLLNDNANPYEEISTLVIGKIEEKEVNRVVKPTTRKQRLDKWNDTVIPDKSHKWKFVEGEKQAPDLRNHCVVCNLPVEFVSASYGRAMIGWFPKYVEELILLDDGTTVPNIKKVMIPLLKTGDICPTCLVDITGKTYVKDNEVFDKFKPLDRPKATAKEGARTVPASMAGVRASKQDNEARPRARDGEGKVLPVKTFVAFVDRKTGEEERWIVPNEKAEQEPVHSSGFNAFGLNRKGGRKSYG